MLCGGTGREFYDNRCGTWKNPGEGSGFRDTDIPEYQRTAISPCAESCL